MTVKPALTDSQLFNWLFRNASTLYLFTKADLKVVVLPITCLAVASAPLTSLARLPHVIFWVWLQVLSLDLSNQVLDPEEDKKNKPYRPIPSGRISLRTAIVLRWILPFICFAWSASYSNELLHASIFNCLLVVVYDEMGFAGGHWFGRQVLNALGHVSCALGASLLAGQSIHTLDPIAVRSILCSGGLVFFTIQAQDFKDTVGDAAVGRRTLPIAHPKLARPSFMMLITACSIGLCSIWQLPLALAVPFIAFGTMIGWLFVMKTSKGEDKKHLFLYLIWLSIAHAMPAYFRFIVAQAAWV